MIDLGDGSVLEHLHEIGVKKVEWLLFTGHHRELSQGVSKLDRAATQVAAPKEEQAFFEAPTAFRKSVSAAERQVRGAWRELCAPARTTGESGSLARGWRCDRMARSKDHLPPHAGALARRHELPTGGQALPRRRHARRLEDDELVRYRVGITASRRDSMPSSPAWTN